MIADNFFQAAFGGSFLNHQFLIAARGARRTRTRRRRSTRCSTRPASRTRATRSTTRDPSATYRDSDFTIALPGAAGDARVRQLRGQHDAAGERAVRQLRRQARRADVPDDRRPPHRQGRSTGPGTPAAGRTRPAPSTSPGWTNGSGPTCSDPNHDPAFTYPKCPDNVFQYHHQPFVVLRELRPGSGRASASQGRAGAARRRWPRRRSPARASCSRSASSSRSARRTSTPATRASRRARPPRVAAPVHRGARLRARTRW